MIQNISMPKTSLYSFKQNKQIDKPDVIKKGNPVKSYADSFVKNAEKSLPVLTVMTAMWTAIDVYSRKVPIKQALLNNMKGFFAPVLLFSSALLALIENKNEPKKDN